MTSKEALESLHIWEYSKDKDKLDIIKRDLEVLDLIKSKKVDISFLAISEDINEYNDYNFHLTEDEYNKVKEWMEK